jgi:hypothetical protein
VTALAPELEVLVVFDGLALVVVVAGLEELVVVAGLVAEAVVERWRARTGSCPVTRITVMSSQVATNSARAPATTRRRIMRTRAARARLTAAPRARALEEIVGGIVGL